MTHTLDDPQIQTCPSDSSHQHLTQTLQMFHRPSIFTRKPSIVPQMWSPCSLSQWLVPILGPWSLLQPLELAISQILWLLPPKISGIFFLFWATPDSSVVDEQDHLSILGSTPIAQFLICPHPLSYVTPGMYTWSSLSTRKAITLLFKVSKFLY